MGTYACVCVSVCVCVAGGGGGCSVFVYIIRFHYATDFCALCCFGSSCFRLMLGGSTL